MISSLNHCMEGKENISPVMDDILFLREFYSMLDEPERFDYFLNLPERGNPEQTHLNEYVREQQQLDQTLLG